MKALVRNPGITTGVAAVLVLVVGGFAGVPLIWTLLVSFALVVLGATLVNGTYVLRRLFVVIPTLILVTAFTFWLKNGRGNKHDLAFILLGPGCHRDRRRTDQQGVPPRRTVVAPLHAVAERRPPRRPRAFADPGPAGLVGDRPGRARDAAADALREHPRLIIAIPAGVYAAYKANKLGDRVTTFGALFFLSIPNFVLADRAGAVLRHRWRSACSANRSAGRSCRRRATSTSGRAPPTTSNRWPCQPSPWHSGWRPSTCACSGRT